MNSKLNIVYYGFVWHGEFVAVICLYVLFPIVFNARIDIEYV